MKAFLNPKPEDLTPANQYIHRHHNDECSYTADEYTIRYQDRDYTFIYYADPWGAREILIYWGVVCKIAESQQPFYRVLATISPPHLGWNNVSRKIDPEQAPPLPLPLMSAMQDYILKGADYADLTHIKYLEKLGFI